MDCERINHTQDILKLIKGKIDELDSPVKTKSKYYKKLLNFYDIMNPEGRPKSASSPNKSPQVFNFTADSYRNLQQVHVAA